MKQYKGVKKVKPSKIVLKRAQKAVADYSRTMREERFGQCPYQ